MQIDQFYQYDLSSASDFVTAHSLQYVSTQPAPVVIQYFRHAYKTPACLPPYFTLTLAYVHTVPDGLPSFADCAVSGICHRIHTTKKINQSVCSVTDKASAKSFRSGPI